MDVESRRREKVVVPLNSFSKIEGFALVRKAKGG